MYIHPVLYSLKRLTHKRMSFPVPLPSGNQDDDSLFEDDDNSNDGFVFAELDNYHLTDYITFFKWCGFYI